MVSFLSCCQCQLLTYVLILTRAVDPQTFFADPDPAVFFNADPDPAVFFNADPDPA